MDDWRNTATWDMAQAVSIAQEMEEGVINPKFTALGLEVFDTEGNPTGEWVILVDEGDGKRYIVKPVSVKYLGIIGGVNGRTQPSRAATSIIE